MPIKLLRFMARLRGFIGVRRLKFNKTSQITLGRVLEKMASRAPGKSVLLFNNDKISYREFNERANQYAHLFLNLRLTKGDAVALYMTNSPEFLIIHAGLAKIGIIVSLINTNLSGEALWHAINTSNARIMIVDFKMRERIQCVKSDLILKKPGIIFVHWERKEVNVPQGMQDLQAAVCRQPRVNPRIKTAITSGDVLEYIFTSGTTGWPKPTRITHRKWLQLGYGAGGMCLGATANDVQYCCLPLYHNSAINLAWSTTLMHGGTFALSRKFSVSQFWRDVREYNATLLVYIGEMCRYLVNQPAKPDDGDNPLLYILGTGIRGEYWQQFQKRFGIKRIIEVYGTTEGVGALVNLKGIPGMIGKLNTAMMRMGEVVRFDTQNHQFIRNEQGFFIKCNPGETGMFLARLSKVNQFSGYQNNPGATREKVIHDVFKKGDSYFISGDLFQLHRNDYVSFVDRLGDSFRWKSELVSTNEVSDVLNRYKPLEDCNVYGVKVPKTEGRAGMAAITLVERTKLDQRNFAEYIIKNLPSYARPYFIRIRRQKDATSTFKQIKYRLQQEGYNPNIISDPLYFLDPAQQTLVKLTPSLYGKIQHGCIRF